MDSLLIKKIVEAALMVAGQPLTLGHLVALFPEGEQPPKDALREAISSINEDCEQRGIEIKEVASGYRFQVKQEIFPHLNRMWEEKPQRYSRALLETLALIAYRQPITRGEIEEVRGVSVSTNIIRTLEERDWIRVIGHRDVPGKPALFGTTKEFLDYFNLSSLDQLPTLAELRDIEELEPELALDTQAQEQNGESAESNASDEASQEVPNTDQQDDKQQAGISETNSSDTQADTSGEQSSVEAETTSETDEQPTLADTDITDGDHSDSTPNEKSTPDVVPPSTELDTDTNRGDLFPHIDVFADDSDEDEAEDAEDPALALDLDAILAEVDEVLDHTAASQNITIEDSPSSDEGEEIAYTEAEDEEAVAAEQARAALLTPEAQLDLAVNQAQRDQAPAAGDDDRTPPTDDDVSEVH